MNLYYLIQSTDKFEGKKIDPFGSAVSFPDIVFEEGSTAWNGEKISIEVFTSLEEARKVFETKKTKHIVSGDFLYVLEWLIESYELTVDDKDIDSVIESIKKNPYIQNEHLKYDGIEDCTHRTFKACIDYEDEKFIKHHKEQSFCTSKSMDAYTKAKMWCFSNYNEINEKKFYINKCGVEIQF